MSDFVMCCNGYARAVTHLNPHSHGELQQHYGSQRPFDFTHLQGAKTRALQETASSHPLPILVNPASVSLGYVSACSRVGACNL